jgi:Xaa-Pro aminopeptidase
MIVTDEPGVYFPRRFGIRIENELLVREHKKNFYGQFLCFEDITYCPYDLDAVDTAYLTDEEIGWINEYHRNVYEKIAPRLNEEEREWLKEATRELKRV